MSLHCTDFLIGLLTRLQVASVSGILRGRTGDADDAWIGLIAPHEAGILDASSGCRDLETPGGKLLEEELLHGGAEEMRSRTGRMQSAKAGKPAGEFLTRAHVSMFVFPEYRGVM